jgi:type IV pilus assembly protein PilW
MSRSLRRARPAPGIGLIELMIALLLGLVMTLGAIALHAQCRRASRAAETAGRLQEVARLALDVLEDDVRMAGHWGPVSRADLLAGRARPGSLLPDAFTAAQGARIDYCGGAGSRWAIDLDEPIGGSDDGYRLACRAFANAPAHGADTLVVRRAAGAVASTLEEDRIHLQASPTGGALFVPASACTDAASPACVPASHPPPAGRARTLVVNAYYVAARSTQRTDLPALRRKAFGNVNAATVANAITDEEIVAGVEDLQLRFGVDTGDDGNVDAYVDPGAVPAGATVVSATVWLRIRAEDPEAGHVDDRAYRYADMAGALVPGDGYRRLLVSRTIHLRNSRR